MVVWCNIFCHYHNHHNCFWLLARISVLLWWPVSSARLLRQVEDLAYVASSRIAAKAASRSALLTNSCRSKPYLCAPPTNKAPRPLLRPGRTLVDIYPLVVSPAPEIFPILNDAAEKLNDVVLARGGHVGPNDTNEDIARARDDLLSLTHLPKDGYRIAVGTGGKVKKRNAAVWWDIVPSSDLQKEDPEKQTPDTSILWYSQAPEMTKNVIQLAHEALQLVASAAENNQEVDVLAINAIEEQALHRLSVARGSDIGGRSSADAAFTFALAGIRNPTLFDTLASVAAREMRGKMSRISITPKVILHIAEKIAASGLTGPHAEEVYEAAATCIELKGVQTSFVAEVRAKSFGMFSNRPLLWLWRFLAQQPKQKLQLSSYNAPISLPWDEIFDDPTKPLVVDVGCGMGVSILGLASLDQEISTDTASDHIDWHNCNYAAADLSRLFIGYASSIASRRELDGRVCFRVCPAEEFLECISRTYPGSVRLIMLQFPTPFRFNTSVEGNSQLPSSMLDGFMVTGRLLKSAADALQKDGEEGQLLLQHKVEDVAVAMRNLAMEEANFVKETVPYPVRGSADEEVLDNLPRRTLNWIQAGGQRARGDEWSSKPIIPSRGASETEIACLHDGVPIHRCLLKA